MPATTGVVQDEGVPMRASPSTTQSQQEPKASTASVVQSFGTWMPAGPAARITALPGGTVTANPSRMSVTGAAPETGVAAGCRGRSRLGG